MTCLYDEPGGPRRREDTDVRHTWENSLFVPEDPEKQLKENKEKCHNWAHNDVLLAATFNRHPLDDWDARQPGDVSGCFHKTKDKI